ncbi:hypothetical protein OG539_35205 [Actinacidiphila glaucinigra]|uniref:hypothetical protein n=1 Tax=Actinacidiphila glaucinigra TaxID=235986 RepID=UPI002DD7C7A3|nr:hypothetical protein [Actinacidiphila glaucinigra]WSD58871.1 hypothetical protein OIE69_08075 [Actinacidiphila glaucinigra]
MLLLGFVLMGATAAFTGLLIAENLGGGPDYTVTLFGSDIATVNTLGAFLAGLALALVFCLASVIALAGAGRERSRRAELRRLRRRARAAETAPDTTTAGTTAPAAGTARTDDEAATTQKTPSASSRRRGMHLFGH